MKTVLATQYIDVPEGVTVDVKAREVVVKGPRGELKRAFKVCMELERRWPGLTLVHGEGWGLVLRMPSS
jgi:ribosomal protein L6P/L9E